MPSKYFPTCGQGKLFTNFGVWIYEKPPFIMLRAWRLDKRTEDVVCNSYELSKEGFSDALEFYNHLIEKPFLRL